MSSYDLLIKGADVLDPGAGIAGRNDLAVRDGLVAAIEPVIDPGLARTVIEAGGQYLVPGLVDLHTHIYPEATYWGVDPLETAWRTGVTTWVDAGLRGRLQLPGPAAAVARASRCAPTPSSTSRPSA